MDAKRMAWGAGVCFLSMVVWDKCQLIFGRTIEYLFKALKI